MHFFPKWNPQQLLSSPRMRAPETPLLAPSKSHARAGFSF